jgi:hypothetical protein
MLEHLQKYMQQYHWVTHKSDYCNDATQHVFMVCYSLHQSSPGDESRFRTNSLKIWRMSCIECRTPTVSAQTAQRTLFSVAVWGYSPKIFLLYNSLFSNGYLSLLTPRPLLGNQPLRPYTLTTHCKQLSTTREVASFADTQKLTSILWNPNVSYCVHKGNSSVPVLGQINLVDNIPSYPSNIYLEISYKFFLKIPFILDEVLHFHCGTKVQTSIIGYAYRCTAGHSKRKICDIVWESGPKVRGRSITFYWLTGKFKGK